MSTKNKLHGSANALIVSIFTSRVKSATCHNAPYASKLLKGNFEIYDCFGRTLATIVDVGDRNVVYRVKQHDYYFPQPGTEWWIKWIDPRNERIFIVHNSPRGKGMQVTFREFLRFFDSSVRRVLPGKSPVERRA